MSAQGPKAPRALVVDDEPHLRLYLAAILRAAGFETATARDGGEALGKIRAAPPDLVSLDLMMPGEGGLKLYQALKADAALRAIPVMVVSAVSEKALGHALATLGAGTGAVLPPPGAYVEKPPDPAVVRDAALRLVGPGGPGGPGEPVGPEQAVG